MKSNLLATLAANLASMGVSGGDANFILQYMNAVHRGTRHRTRTTRLAGRRSRCKLRIARGPGSISAKSDALQLARAGKFLLAYDVALQHKRQCGEQLFPQEVLDAWMMEGHQ